MLDRPTQGIKAAGTALSNQVNFTYDDTAKTITSEGDLTSSGDKALKGRAFYDGLGRTFRKASYEGSTWSIVDTRFDALGRVSQVSNPYRATDPATATAPANTWTTTTYDALGRVLTVTTPDNAVVTSAYSGNRVLVMDQAGKQRLSETDALGHLKNVWEIRAADAATVPVSFPNHAEVTAGYLTSYSYDTLDNLKTVTQGSQTRTFVYDSLKRLSSATNPESGRSVTLTTRTAIC